MDVATKLEEGGPAKAVSEIGSDPSTQQGVPVYVWMGVGATQPTNVVAGPATQVPAGWPV